MSGGSVQVVAAGTPSSPTLVGQGKLSFLAAQPPGVSSALGVEVEAVSAPTTTTSSTSSEASSGELGEDVTAAVTACPRESKGRSSSSGPVALAGLLLGRCSLVHVVPERRGRRGSCANEGTTTGGRSKAGGGRAPTGGVYRRARASTDASASEAREACRLLQGAWADFDLSELLIRRDSLGAGGEDEKAVVETRQMAPSPSWASRTRGSGRCSVPSFRYPQT